MHTKLKSMHDECATILARASSEMEVVRRPVRNEVLLHYREARHMQQRAQELDLIPLRCQALKAAYQLHNVPATVEADTTLWPSLLRDEEDLAIDPDMEERNIEATIVGYLSPYVRAIGIRGLQVRARFSMFDEHLYLTLKAPVFP